MLAVTDNIQARFCYGVSYTSSMLITQKLFTEAREYRLSSGCTLLLAGSIADILGNRIMNLCGGFLLGLCILASGLSRTGIEFIIFRALQGIAISMSFPTAFSILTDAFPGGRRRNIAFAFLGLMQPFGWAIGLVLGGLFESGPLGWRFGFYLCAGLTIIFSVVNCWKLPRDRARGPISWDSLRTGIDWVGVVLSSTSLGLFSYVLA
jgi:MFS family permease